ncbi:TIGR03086 family metal-binding protein [Streptomyces sp. 4N509B]|uniref:TIGR03086 family metal-binding protein n=1 Tax=Streptomyces sp. 4N509B TaxID=3457413 RepID=UPI003FD09B8E
MTTHDNGNDNGSDNAPAANAPDDDARRLLDLGPVARQLAGLLDGVEERHYDRPTPCPDYTVRELLGHLLGLTLAFTAAARKEFGPLTATDPGSAPPPPLTEDWRERLRRQLDELVAAWRDPAAWEGDTQAGGITFPASVAGPVALNEVLLHGWDLARATGQPYVVEDEASLGASTALLSQQTSPEEREGTGFGPVVPVAGDASPLDRVVGLSGRSPDWSPPSPPSAP